MTLTEHQVSFGDSGDKALHVVLGAVPDYIHYGTTFEEVTDILNHVLKAVHVMGNNVRRHEEDMVPHCYVTDKVNEAVREAVNPSYIEDLISKMEAAIEMKQGTEGPRGHRGDPGVPGVKGERGLPGMHVEEKLVMQEQLERIKDIEMQIQDILEDMT